MKTLKMSIVSAFFLVFIFGNLLPTFASSGTNVNGPIREDTVWTKQGSPYNLTGTIQIAQGTKLIIEPGVIVNGGHGSILEVYGDLNIVSDLNSRVTLNKTSITAQTLNVQNIDMLDGGISTQNLILKDSRMYNANVNVVNKADVERNIIAQDDIRLGDNSTVINNLFYEDNIMNTFGSNAMISKNTFLHSKITGAVDITNNYWGTTDEKEIQKEIIDGNDNLFYPFSIFNPFLTNPNPNTPTLDLRWVPALIPNKPIISGGSISDATTYVKGYVRYAQIPSYDKRHTIYAMVGNKRIGIVKSTQPNFTMKIQKQKAGTIVNFYVENIYNQKSPITKVKVEDGTPPAIPTVNKVTSKSKFVTGKGEPRTTVIVYIRNNLEIGRGKVDSKGNFKVAIKPRPKNTILTIYLQDAARNFSKGRIVKVY